MLSEHPSGYMAKVNPKTRFYTIIDLTTGRVLSWKVNRQQGIDQLMYVGLSEHEAELVMDTQPDNFEWRKAYRIGCELAEAERAGQA